MKSYGETDGNGWQQDKETCRMKMPALVPCGGLPGCLPESMPGQMLTGKQKSVGAAVCLVQCKWNHLGWRLVKGSVTSPELWAPAAPPSQTLTWNVRQFSFTWSPNCTVFASVSNYCQSPSGEDRLEKRPEAARNLILPSWRDSSLAVNSVSVPNGSSDVYRINKWTSS